MTCPVRAIEDAHRAGQQVGLDMILAARDTLAAEGQLFDDCSIDDLRTLRVLADVESHDRGWMIDHTAARRHGWEEARWLGLDHGWVEEPLLRGLMGKAAEAAT